MTTRTTFVLPPLLATAATKYGDPEWRFRRSISVFVSYIISAIIAIMFTGLGLVSMSFALLGSLVSLSITSLLSVEHPPSILATFLGIMERASPIYILHPVATGIAIVELTNYGATKLIPKA